MRGFGNNDAAVVNSGWSKGRAYFMIYLISGIFATMGGVAFSAITGASDVNAAATFTLLTVAAVIIGGGYFSGGVVTHIGAVLGAISLTMISVLLGLMNISTDYTATIQGLVLLVILSLRIFKRGEGTIND
jgi:ribose transport system ATP-binding protein